MAIQIQAMIFIFYILLANFIYADANCNLFHEMYIFAKGAVEKFVPQKYQNLGCLAYVFQQPKATCDIKTLFLPINSKSCEIMRKNDLNIMTKGIQRFQSKHIGNALNSNDLDDEQICGEVLRFNQKPSTEKTKAKYIEFYKSDAGYLPYAYVGFFFISFGGTSGNSGEQVFKYYGQCVLKTNDVVRKYFGNLPPPKWNRKYPKE